MLASWLIFLDLNLLNYEMKIIKAPTLIDYQYTKWSHLYTEFSLDYITLNKAESLDISGFHK